MWSATTDPMVNILAIILAIGAALAILRGGFRAPAKIAIAVAAIVAVFLPVAFLLRATAFYRIGVLRIGSLAVAALASWWLVERMFDLAPA